MLSEVPLPPPPPPPPPPLPPPEEYPPDVATDDPISHLSTATKHVALVDAASTLERLRSLHSEREACTLFASSLLAHPLGASFNGSGADDGGDIGKNSKLNPLLADPLYPSSLPGGVRDAWASLSRSSRPLDILGEEVDDLADDTAENVDVSSALAEGTIITASMIEKELAKEKRHENEEYTLNNGQLSIACRMAALRAVISREVELMNLLEKDVKRNGTLLEGARKTISDNADSKSIAAGNGSTYFMNSFYQRLNAVKVYHSQNNIDREADPNYLALGGGVNQSNNNSLPMLLSGQKRKHGHPLADGYDIASLIANETTAVRLGEVFTPEERYGKSLDLVTIYEGEVRSMRHVFKAENEKSSSISIISYLDFLSILSKGLNTSVSESAKLRDRRKYARFLRLLEKYLTAFLRHTSPFLNISVEVIAKSIASFEREWRGKGCVDGWECRTANAALESDKSSQSDDKPLASSVGIELSKYATSSDLGKNVSGDDLKIELARLGLKCGGSVSDRAVRLFLTKYTPLDKLPTKVFAKKNAQGAKKTKTGISGAAASVQNRTSKNAPNLIADSRVCIARQEAIVSSLLDQLRPTLEGTRRRVERRTTQTENEKDQELEEDINGVPIDESNPRDGEKGGGDNDSADEEDGEDAPIYNPKNVPLGWDGKPIPYWLFKLHGLNHFYPCEICGNESYRGRRNFEKHFTESRHAYGMRCLSIPNTKHFHGVTKIADAQELWGRLRTVLEGNQFDVDQEEEYEDSHGNVLNRAQYEDLARQGLL